MTEYKLSMINWMNCIWTTDMPSQSKLIAAYLRSHMNDHHDIAWPSLSTIQGKTNLARSTVVKYIDVLCAQGWLTRDLNARTSTTYIATFPKPIQDGLKVLSNSTPDELASIVASTRDELGSTPDELVLVRETNPNKQSNKQVNKQGCFEAFWKNWIACKKEVGQGGNYGVKAEALKRWNSTIGKAKNIETENEKAIEFMLDVYSDISDMDKIKSQSQYFNYRNMFPQKFLSNGAWNNE